MQASNNTQAVGGGETVWFYSLDQDPDPNPGIALYGYDQTDGYSEVARSYVYEVEIEAI